MLTEKCKISFEKWLIEQLEMNTPIGNAGYELTDIFDELPFSMQYGVYVEFFDIVGIIIDIIPFADYDKNSYTKIDFFNPNIIVLNQKEKEDDEGFKEIKSRKEAQEQAIIKANEIFNTLNN